MPLCLYPRHDGSMYRSPVHCAPLVDGKDRCVMCLKKITMADRADTRFPERAWQTVHLIKEWP